MRGWRVAGDAGRGPPRRTWAIARPALLAWVAVLVVGVLYLARRAPIEVGDGVEYQASTEALFAHGTPDIRAGDLAHLSGLFRADGSAPGWLARRCESVRSERGPTFTIHFWSYSLAVVPAKAVLHLLHGDELAASQVTNFVVLWLAVAFALRVGPGSPRDRAWFVALCLVQPVVWYVPWPSPEVETWALVVTSLVAWRARRHGLASAAAAVASWQNPGALCLAALSVGSALRARDRRAVLAAVGGAALAVVAPAFNLYFFGDMSLVHRVGGADVHRVGLARAWSLLFDLNQGMLPYVPGLLALAAAGLVLWRSAAGVACALVALAMVFICGAPPNWNAGVTGIQRYSVWIVPVVACVVALDPPPGRWRARLWGATVALQGVIVLLGSSDIPYTRHTPLAAFVLDHAPALYNPDPEIFAERTLEMDGYKGELPVVYTSRAGVVTKVMTDWASLAWLFERYDVDPAYRARVTGEHDRDEGIFYLEPPPGAVRSIPAVPRDRVAPAPPSGYPAPETRSSP